MQPPICDGTHILRRFLVSGARKRLNHKAFRPPKSAVQSASSGHNTVLEGVMLQTICLWSGPRNISTALMYGFAQRNDIRVVDEPLYGHYLRASAAQHPGRDDVMAAMNCDGDKVIEELLQCQTKDTSKRLFLKSMAHHLVDIDLQFLAHTCNIFLIRDPAQMLPSLRVQLPRATLVDTGLQQQWQLYSNLVAGKNPTVIIDARELLLNPESVLKQLCKQIELPFVADMLHWPAGPRAEDGVWAPHWYQAVHRSTGFSAYRAKINFPPELEPLLAECKPWYDMLYAHAIRAD